MTTETMADVFAPHGRHLVAGEWVGTADTFRSEPAHGTPHSFSVGTPALVAQAAEAAEEAFWSYGYADREMRAAFLEAIADEITTDLKGEGGSVQKREYWGLRSLATGSRRTGRAITCCSRWTRSLCSSTRWSASWA